MIYNSTRGTKQETNAWGSHCTDVDQDEIFKRVRVEYTKFLDKVKMPAVRDADEDVWRRIRDVKAMELALQAIEEEEKAKKLRRQMDKEKEQEENPLSPEELKELEDYYYYAYSEYANREEKEEKKEYRLIRLVPPQIKKEDNALTLSNVNKTLDNLYLCNSRIPLQRAEKLLRKTKSPRYHLVWKYITELCQKAKRDVFLLNYSKIAANTSLNMKLVRWAVKYLSRKGIISNCYVNGIPTIANPVGRVNVLHKIVYDALPTRMNYFHKRFRRKYAKMFCIKEMSILRMVKRLPFIELIKDNKGRIWFLLIKDVEAAQKFVEPHLYALEDAQLWRSAYRRNRYYKLNKPYQKEKTSSLPLSNLERVLFALASKGGMFKVRIKDLAKECKISKQLLYYYLNRLKGTIFYNLGIFKVVNPYNIFILFYLCNRSRKLGKLFRCPPPSLYPHLYKYRFYKKNFISAFSNYFGKRRLRKKLLLLEEKLEKELKKFWILLDATTLLFRYNPRYFYAKGCDKIMSRFEELSNFDNDESLLAPANHKSQYGKAQRVDEMYIKRGQLASRFIKGIRDTIGISGAVNKELISFIVSNSWTIMPTHENPEIDTFEKICDFIENVLPVKEDYLNMVCEYCNYIGAKFVSEFIARGGIHLLLLLMQAETEPTATRDLYLWHACVLVEYVKQTREAYLSKLFIDDAWKTIIGNIITGWNIDMPVVSGFVVLEALSRYINLGGDLKKLHNYKNIIAAKLVEKYPRKTEYGVMWDCAWDELTELHECEMVSDDIYSTLLEWVAEVTENTEKSDNKKVLPCSLSWYKMKLRSAEAYGLPGDIDALKTKIEILERIDELSPDEIDDAVDVLNLPTKYDNPNFTFEEWTELAQI